jgi:hypothetical protein
METRRVETTIIVVGNFVVLVALVASVSTWFFYSLIAGGIILVGYRASVRRLVTVWECEGSRKESLTWGSLTVISLVAAIVAVVCINRMGQPL